MSGKREAPPAPQEAHHAPPDPLVEWPTFHGAAITSPSSNRAELVQKRNVPPDLACDSCNGGNNCVWPDPPTEWSPPRGGLAATPTRPTGNRLYRYHEATGATHIQTRKMPPDPPDECSLSRGQATKLPPFIPTVATFLQKDTRRNKVAPPDPPTDGSAFDQGVNDDDDRGWTMRVIAPFDYAPRRHHRDPSDPRIEYEFLLQCQRLRDNTRRTKKVDTEDAIRGYGYQLGRALLRNSTVEHICLCMSKFFYDGIDQPADQAAPMLEYIRESQELQSVALVGNQDDFNLSGQILMAIADNPHVNSVRINSTPSVQDFVHFFSRVPSLSKLEIGAMTFVYFFDGGVSTADSHTIVDALAFKTTVERMSLDFERTPNCWVKRILSRLRTHCRLRHLKIGNDRDRPIAEMPGGVRFFIESPRQPGVVIFLPPLLQSLLLSRVELDLEASELLREGFRSNQTCRVLSLLDCKFTAEATDNMITFFQLEANRNLSVLEEVHIFVNECSNHADSRTFLEREVRHVIPAMLRGSALKKFKLMVGWTGLIAGVEGLYRELSESAAEICVPSLEFQHAEPDEAATEAQCEFIRATATLQELRVSAEWGNSSPILLAMRQNGSLLRAAFLENAGMEDEYDDCLKHAVSIFDPDYGDDDDDDDDDDDEPEARRAGDDHDEPETRRAEAYLMRNAMLPAMVVAPVLSDNVANGAVGGPDLVGELFAVAMHAPGTAPNMLLRGLSAAWAEDLWIE